MLKTFIKALAPPISIVMGIQGLNVVRILVLKLSQKIELWGGVKTKLLKTNLIRVGMAGS